MPWKVSATRNRAGRDPVVMGATMTVRKCAFISSGEITTQGRVSWNLAVVEEFASLLEVLPYTAKASQHYGAVRAALEKAGLPIGVNDLHIAAHARSEGLTLVTNNLSEFERVPGLLTENWVGTVA